LSPASVCSSSRTTMSRGRTWRPSEPTVDHACAVTVQQSERGSRTVQAGGLRLELDLPRRRAEDVLEGARHRGPRDRPRTRVGLARVRRDDRRSSCQVATDHSGSYHAAGRGLEQAAEVGAVASIDGEIYTATTREVDLLDPLGMASVGESCLLTCFPRSDRLSCRSRGIVILPGYGPQVDVFEAKPVKHLLRTRRGLRSESSPTLGGA